MNNQKNSLENVLSFKGFFRVLFKQKISFFASFLVILALGLSYTFIIGPQYCSISEIKVTEDNVYYKDMLYKYLPSETDNLWIIPSKANIDYVVSKLDPITAEIKYDEILNKVQKEVDKNISKSNMAGFIDPVVNRTDGTLVFNVYTKNRELSFLINKSLLNALIDYKKIQFEAAYNDLLKKVDSRINQLNEEFNQLSKEAEDYVIELNLKYSKAVESSNDGSVKNVKSLDFISPLIEKQLDLKFEELTAFTAVKDNLVNDKNLFLNRIQVIIQPEMFDVRDYSHYFRNIVLSIFAAIISGLVIAFIVNYFKTNK